MNDWKLEFEEKLTTPEEAVKCIHDGDTVYIGTCTSTAYALTDALGERGDELKDIKINCSHIRYPTRIMTGRDKDTFAITTFFMGAQERVARADGANVDFTSMHLSQVDVFCRDIIPARVAFLEVSKPDENGFMSFGATGVALDTYVKEKAEVIILEVNSYAPYVLGDNNRIHVSEADMIVQADRPISEAKDLPATEDILRISEYVVDQIPDGACIQLGIGGVANAVGFGLKNKNDLSAHTELMTNSVMDLMKQGVITNKKKGYIPGKTTASFSLGTKELYDFLDHNEDMYFQPFPVINDPLNIAKNDNMISVNSAIAVDVFGQVCADNIAGRQFSATGGQLDFVKGAQMSKGGKSFIALPSAGVNRKGERFSKITARLPLGAAVTTPRSEVQYVVTEYGCVNLKLLTMRQRVEAMISLAHPDFRDQIREEVREAGIF